MISRDMNPEYLNSFLDYSVTILNKSPNTIKEYNYDLNMFFKFLKIHLKMTKETDFSKIYIKDFNADRLKDITLNDINAFLSYLALNQRKQTSY